MEMNAINVAWHKLYHGKPSFVDKKKANLENYLQTVHEIMEIAIPVATKKLQSLRLDYLAVRIHKFPLKVAKLKYDCRDFRIHEDYVTKTMFTLTEGLSCPGFTTFQNRCKKCQKKN